MRFKELFETKAEKTQLDKPTPTAKELAEKHKVDYQYILKQLEKGIRIELEHTSDTSVAREIALDHLAERPDYYEKLKQVEENFSDGKKPGRKGLAKRSGVNTKASVSSLRKTAKNSSGEKQRMAHWLANMKAGRAKKKTNESVDFEQMQPQNIIAVAQQAFAKLYPNVKLYGKSVVEGVGLTTHKGGEGSASAFAGSDTKRGAFYLTLNAYAEGSSMIVVVEDATAGQYKGATTAIIRALYEAGERLYKSEVRELVVNDNANSDAWSAIADRVEAELL